MQSLGSSPFYTLLMTRCGLQYREQMRNKILADHIGQHYLEAMKLDDKPAKPTNLIVLLAFIRDDEGEVRPAFEAREMPSEEKAKMDARRMAALGTYEGVIAWSRTADLVNGVFGDPVILFQHGNIPPMDEVS